MSEQILGGATSTQFSYGLEADYAAAIEAARLEQEAMCGYPLVLLRVRQTHMRDDQGRDVYEVFATFGPAPVSQEV